MGNTMAARRIGSTWNIVLIASKPYCRSITIPLAFSGTEHLWQYFTISIQNELLRIQRL